MIALCQNQHTNFDDLCGKMHSFPSKPGNCIGISVFRPALRYN